MTQDTPDALGGAEWLVDAEGCGEEPLRSVRSLNELFNRIVADLELHPIGEPVWHVFPGSGGLTGLLLLQESHLGDLWYSGILGGVPGVE